MKFVLNILIGFCACMTFGQTSPRIEKIAIYDRVLHGVIGEDIPITLYLHFHDYSDQNTLVYSVEGWYYYDRYQKKIPLVGIYSGGLVVYSFEHEAQADSILKLQAHGDSPWEQLDDLTSRSGYKERIEIDYQDYSFQGTWKNTQKELPVRIQSPDIGVDALKEYLHVPLKDGKEVVLDLSQIGSVGNDYEIVASRHADGKWRIMLYYATMSTGNPNGMCGAGQEIAYVLLVVDEDGRLVEFSEQVIESCLGNSYFEEMNESTSTVKQLRVIHADDQERMVEVNLETVHLFSEKLK